MANVPAGTVTSSATTLRRSGRRSAMPKPRMSVAARAAYPSATTALVATIEAGVFAAP